MQIRKLVEKNDILLGYYLKIRCFIYLVVFYPYRKLRESFRKYGLDKSNSYIKKIKDIHSGERCFIIGTGPSLTKEDIYKLKSEYTFGTNALCLLFNELKWKTNYFVISDKKAYKKLVNNLPKDDTNNIFISSPKSKDVKDGHTYVPINPVNNYLTTNKYKKFSDNIHVCCYDANTVVFNALQIAIYMGFKEIYLIGVDCNYSDDAKKRYLVDHQINNPYYKSAGRSMIEDFKVAKKYADKFGIKIYNATRGGMLEVFERVNLDKVL
ncbi:6-hydroxymethylpterin diphosphokinase MptE-like protein [Metabacillus sediminilitoris]|uniref:DUF115 domain-containing protein n=1 Tax=Metabacillus sediminilitoris TaxID=2567941 RepID=A0A4S4C1D0_9BACI|nr:6-hydroxymethylpterin diphosphokinase MptE-like protein [Metabacillus sediminilitoris]QGQ48267.1 DUF115 domain-containing protein [Metabacillus sediminilitoris]THF81375.1 DUF115 domain-containing protein [Metabacillus sediminilitoris]